MSRRVKPSKRPVLCIAGWSENSGDASCLPSEQPLQLEWTSRIARAGRWRDRDSRRQRGRFVKIEHILHRVGMPIAFGQMRPMILAGMTARQKPLLDQCEDRRVIAG